MKAFKIIYFFLLWLVMLNVWHSSGADIFVSTTGNNQTGDGSIGNPFATLQKAIDNVLPGDVVYLRGGTYTGMQHTIYTNVSGTSTNPITIRNYQNELVILDGTGVNLSNNSALLYIANWNAGYLSHYIIEGLTVRNSSQRGISYYNVQNLTIRNCIVYNIHTRAIGGWGHHVTIENNEVYNAAMINENGVMGNSGWPMVIYGAVDYDSGDPSTYLTIRNNYVHNCWGEAMGPGRESSNVIIENNTIRDVFSVGIYVDKANSTTIRGNYLYATDPAYYRFGRPFTAISWANEEDLDGGALPVQNIKIYNNLIVGTGKGINYWHDNSNTNSQNSYHNITVVYNTIVDVTHYALWIDEVPAGYTPPSGCIFKNNIVENGSQANYVGNTAAWNFSHNCWVDGVPTFDQSSSSFQGQPHFVNPSLSGGFDAYKLTSWSQCLDAGTPISGITTDYWGKARDASHPAIGMHEPSFTVYYVDAAVSSSGNGKSWATAKKTIEEAANLTLNPGDIVYIKPGTYPEDVTIKSSGAQIVGITANVTVSASNIITFPPGTDLSGIDLENHPEEYYAYVYRSWKSNNGYYKIKAVDDANDFIIVEGADFIYEKGVAGDFNYLSAAIGRPVIYRKYSNDPQNERVILDCSTVPSAWTILYIGNYINPTTYPADFNIIDGLDVTNSENGIHLNNSKFNVLANGRSYVTTQSSGILIHGIQSYPATYNMVINYKIYDTYGEGIYVGKGGGTQAQNHTHYNHLIGNEIYKTNPTATLENAIDLKEYNIGNVAESNLIRSFKLATGGNGAIDIRNGAHHALIYNNVIKDVIGTGTSGTKYLLNLYHETQNVRIFNNLIYLTNAVSDGVYAVNIRGDNTSGNYFVHNTIYNTNRGILVQNYGTGVNVTIANNIFNAINNSLIEEWTNNAQQEGKFTFQNNLFNANPNNYWYPVTSDFIGNANFVNAANGDFHLTSSSTKAINKGASLSFPSIDRDLVLRDGIADLGAYEYMPAATHEWTGAISAAWGNSGNWSQGSVPGSSSVVNIPNGCANYPEVSNAASSPAVVENLNIGGGAQIKVLPGGCLTISGFLRNYNGEAGIVIQSDATGTGSFIAGQTTLATVKRYIAAWTSAIHGWHFLSSPVADQPIQPEFVPDPPTAAQDFYKWDEPTATWINSKQLIGNNVVWNTAFENNFVTGRGYLVAYQNNQTKTFAQTTHVENVTINNLTKSGGNYSGWHLLGNPFTSAIQWNNGQWNLNNIAGTAKIWNEANASYTDIQANGIIPAMNGFMVQVTQNTGSLTIPASARTHHNQSWYKQSDYPVIKLLAKDPEQNTAQESIILFHPQATSGFDPELDSRFLEGYAPKLYTVSENENLSLNALQAIEHPTEIPLHFVKNASSAFELKLIENTTKRNIILIDLKLGASHIFSENNVYSFTSDTGDAENRFLLQFKTTNVSETDFPKPKIQINGNHIKISNAEKAFIEVFNALGQLVLRDYSPDNSYQTSVNSGAGIYLVRIEQEKSVVIEKILLNY